jgi:hypothetical protein
MIANGSRFTAPGGGFHDSTATQSALASWISRPAVPVGRARRFRVTGRCTRRGGFGCDPRLNLWSGILDRFCSIRRPVARVGNDAQAGLSWFSVIPTSAIVPPGTAHLFRIPARASSRFQALLTISTSILVSTSSSVGTSRITTVQIAPPLTNLSSRSPSL